MHFKLPYQDWWFISLKIIKFWLVFIGFKLFNEWLLHNDFLTIKRFWYTYLNSIFFFLQMLLCKSIVVNWLSGYMETNVLRREKLWSTKSYWTPSNSTMTLMSLERGNHVVSPDVRVATHSCAIKRYWPFTVANVLYFLAFSWVVQHHFQKIVQIDFEIYS